MSARDRTRKAAGARSELPLVLAVVLPVLLVRLASSYVRISVKRSIGVRVFRRALVRSGMGPRAVRGLAAQYASHGRLRTYLAGDGRLRAWLPRF